MNIDPMTVLFGASTATAVIAMVKARTKSREVQYWQTWLQMTARERDHLRDINSGMIGKDNARKAHLREIAAKGKATQMARHRERKAIAEAERPARIAKTITEFSTTPMRSRAQVVAPVKARRTRTKKSGAGAAATKEGWGASS